MSVGTLSEPLTLPAVSPVRAAAVPEDALFEVVYGQRVEKPVSFEASWISSRLQLHLGNFVELGQLGTVVPEAIFILDREADLQRRPDVAFLSVARLPLFSWPEKGEIDIVPNLAVEVVSPNDLFRSVMGKVREYFDHGVERVWVVLPEERRVYVFRSAEDMQVLTDKQDLTDDALFPGWRMPVAKLFRPAV